MIAAIPARCSRVLLCASLAALVVPLCAADPQSAANAAGASATKAAEASATSSLPSALSSTAAYTAEEIAAFHAAATEQGLAADATWLTLLHVTRGWFSTKSRVDDPQFFLAPTGKQDPAAELTATLAGLFIGDPARAEDAVAARFPARCEWLCTKLDIDRRRLPVPGSPAFEEAVRALGPRSAALVFPAAYMNRPASMFGHTLLIIRSRYQSALLSQAVNYAAVTTETNGVLFAFKGIFGLYPGYYSLLPYYQKVQEYGDIDQRDVWEYDLNLDAAELRRLLLHTWELRGIASDYFFFDENCSACLMDLLDAARPGTGLAQQQGAWVIPLDTVRAVRAAGLVQGVQWRPSRATKVRRGVRELPAADRELIAGIAEGRVGPDAVSDHASADAALILDLAADFLHALRGREVVAQAEYQPRQFEILRARSRIAGASALALPPPASPDSGHGSGRLAIGGGVWDAADFVSLGYRPAYHDLLDPQAGYLPGSQIQFGNLELRAYSLIPETLDADRLQSEPPRVDLHRLEAIGLRSLSPRDAFFQPLSWHVAFGLTREREGDTGAFRRDGYLAGGCGLAYRLPGTTSTSGEGGMLVAFAEADARVHADAPPTLGAGAALAALIPLGDSVVLLPQARALRYTFGRPASNWSLSLDARFSIAGCALTISAAQARTWGFTATSGEARLNWYF